MKTTNDLFLFRISQFFRIDRPILPVILVAFVVNFSTQILQAQTVDPVMSLENNEIEDQDDMCIWIHPTDPSQSVLITADKAVDKLFVYDLDGNTVQSLNTSGRPGNIDIRYNFMLSGQPVDIIGFNDRVNEEIVFYTIDVTTRQLSFISSFNAGSWPEEIYGFCLYQNLDTDKFYAFACGKSSQIRQWELKDNGDGTIGGVELRTWQNGSDQTEGMVADDETGYLYAANEVEGVYKYDLNSTNPNPLVDLIAPTGQHNLEGDVEGVTIYYAANGEGYLLVSDQGSDSYKVFERKAPHNFVKTFEVNGASGTDGIDVININLGPAFPQGLFVLHNDENEPKENLVCAYEDLQLAIDTDYWHPRNNGPSTAIDNAGEFPSQFTLSANYPNPFNPATNIRFRTESFSTVELQIFDIKGSLVKTLVNENRAAGEYSIVWDATDNNGKAVASGVYFYQLKANDLVQTRKMQLIR